MLRGEFRTPSGLVIPNNITKFGADTILKAALRNTVPTFWVGLVDAVPTQDLLIQNVIEPTFTNGYARVQITRDVTGWPTSGEVNGEPFLESDWLTFEATGGNFSQPIRRMMVVASQNATTGNVIALSAPLPALSQITPTTALADRRFKYRIYSR